MSSREPMMARERPGLAQRLFFKSPIYLYHGWLAELFRWRCVMLITTTGRKTGLPRTNGVSFMPLDDHYVVFAGWGRSSNWYQNLRANPRVTIQVGRLRTKATARLVEDPERRRELMLRMRDLSRHCGPPWLMRPLLSLSGVFDYEGEIRRAVEHAENLPVIELIPDR